MGSPRSNAASSCAGGLAIDRRDGRIVGLRVDDEGLLVAGSGDFPVNVDFDDQRVFSFWLERDTVDRKGAALLRLAGPAATLPERLRDRLAELAGRRREVGLGPCGALGTGEGTIAVVDGQGNPMGLDKSMRLSRLFGGRDDADMAPLLDALDEVLGALEAGRRAPVRRLTARCWAPYGTATSSATTPTPTSATSARTTIPRT